MEAARCSVESWAGFGDSNTGSAKVICSGTEVLFSTGGNEVLIFTQKQRVSTIFRFDSPVIHLALSIDEHHLYALCENDGIYCTTLSPQSSVPSTELCPDPILSTVSPDSFAVKDERVCSFILVEEILVTVILQDSAWTFGLYKVPDFSSETARHRKLTEFQVPVVASARSPRDTAATESRGGTHTPPVLSCIYPGGSLAPRTHNGHGHFLMEPVLFGLLFGVDAALLHSPVVLCGLPDGRLCCLPLFSSEQAGPRGEERQRVRVLHSLEQPIIFIGTSVTREMGQSCPQCLVAIGQRGRVLLVRSEEAGSEGRVAGFSEHNVRGPVLCACVDSSHLYYSTTSDLLALQLNKASSAAAQGPGERSSSGPDKPAPTNQSPVSLNVCRVVALAESPSSHPTGAVQLVALSLSGRLLQVTLPPGSDRECVSRIPSSQLGQRVKDLLAGIGNVWERASLLKSTVQSKNEALRRLNQALNVCCLLLPNQKAREQVPDHKQPISCHTVTSWSSLLQRESLILTCVLENASAYVLEQGWTLSVQVQAVSRSLTAGGATTTYLFPFQKLDEGQKLEVNLPLGTGSSLSLPVEVRCSLVWSLLATLGPKEPGQHLTNGSTLSQLVSDTGCISLALNTLTVDWLDGLRLHGPASHSSLSRHATSTNAIRGFLSSRGVQSEGGEGTAKAGPFTAAVRVSSELLRARLKPPGAGGLALCVSVLSWLLAGCSGAGGQRPVLGPVVCAHCPGGHAVRLMAKEVTLSDACADGLLALVEVRVESVSMATVCGLHHAVLRRVQALLKETAAECESSVQLKGQSLRQAMQRAESLYNELQEARVPAALGTGMKMRKTTEKLLNIYQELRENPLIIL